MRTVKGWRPLAPFVTRIALSPIFPVAYLEPIFGENDIGVEARRALADVKSSTGSSVQQTRHDLRPSDAGEHCERCKKASDSLRRCSRCNRVA
ncbi:hypothetical protein BD413DRAFT_598370 [Trametes elegans]|nr:hypothetical protein BD413DRAFT_598370 [Trametes elegans]